MTRIVHTHLMDGCPWPDGEQPARIRPIDVARAAATTLSAGSDMDLGRRAMRFCGVVLEVLAHLNGDWSGHRLRTVGLSSLDATARREVVQRIGVGLARIVAERGPLRLIDFYNLDALAADPGAPVTVRRAPHQRRRPDFAGADVLNRWSLLEAKARTEGGQLLHVRRHALRQVRAVDLVDRSGTEIDPVARVSCVASLHGDDITVFADDPTADEVLVRYGIDPFRLTYDYYALVRQLLELVREPGPGISGAVDYRMLPLPIEGLVLGVHQQVLRYLEDPEGLSAVRELLRLTFEDEQPEAEEAQDVALSIGPDGLALAARGMTIQDWIAPE